MQQKRFNLEESGDTAIPNKVEINREKPATKTTRKQALYRASEIAGPNGMFPISLSSWWAGVKSGIYPQPLSLGPRITVWRAEDLEQLAQHGVEGANFGNSSTSSNGGQS